VATVTELSAQTIADNIQKHCTNSQDAVIYVSGGGARNPVLTERIQELIPGKKFRNISELGIDPDAKEAVIFAVLANEMLAGEGFPFDADNGTRKVNFGKISFP
jgi:anhydro-N-acetylmuramic acid kinase